MATRVVSDLVVVPIRTTVDMPAHASSSTIHHLTNRMAHVERDRMVPYPPMVALPQDILNRRSHEAALALDTG